MSALTAADHEESTDELLAARERIEHLTICGAALQAENDRLKVVNNELVESLMLIFNTDISDAALDPIRAIRIAKHALAKAGELK